jgi:hypothetical protein
VILASDNGPTWTWTGSKCFEQINQHSGSTPEAGQVPKSLRYWRPTSSPMARPVIMAVFQVTTESNWTSSIRCLIRILRRNRSKMQLWFRTNTWYTQRVRRWTLIYVLRGFHIVNIPPMPTASSTTCRSALAVQAVFRLASLRTLRSPSPMESLIPCGPIT